MPDLQQRFVTLPTAELEPHPENPRRGDVDVIAESVNVNGFFGAVLVQAPRDGRTAYRIIAGEHRWRAAEREGLPEVPALVVDVDDDAALRMLLADNRTSDVAGYDDAALRSLLASLADSADVLTGSGYDHEAFDGLLDGLREDAARQTLADAPPPERRSLPVDLICCVSNPWRLKLAAMSGWQTGVQSSKVSDRLCEQLALFALHPVFVDNEFKEYDHEEHVTAVARFSPKYATVRDAMTKDQCRAQGIDYYPLGQVLEMAEEIAGLCDNAIVIPKWDCIDDIPEEYVLGYSLPSAYGMTPLPPEALKGRRVHLLGGSWRSQLNALSVLGDDVVALDNNHHQNIARFARCCLPDGTEPRTDDVLGFAVTNPYMVSMAISAASITASVVELCGGGDGSLFMDPDIDTEAEDREGADGAP